MEVCTIIAKNYVAFARVLARSLARSNPGSRLWTLIVDQHSPYIDPATEPFEVLTAADVGCEPFEQMAVRYTVLELCTAVKPWLLRHLMAVTGGAVTYLDPDIRVYGSLERLGRLADRHGVVLVPHTEQPIPSDGRRPGQVDIMIAGTFNLGCVSLAPGPEVDRLLDWWADRLRRDCRVDPLWGYFVDQRWFDLVPGFLTDLAIVRDPEYNVAYWNLHARRLERADGRYLVNGRPLAFFHFSGFDPAHPLALSRHQDRIDVGADPVLERLLAEYAAELTAEGHEHSRGWPYSYAALANGLRPDDTLRALYDRYVEEQRGGNGASASPFTLEGARRFTDWMTAQAPGAPPGVNRILAHVYASRADIREAYPDLAGPERQRLLDWVRERGAHELPLLARFPSTAAGAAAGPSAGEASAAGPAAAEPSAGEASAAQPAAPSASGPTTASLLPPAPESAPAPSPLLEQPWGVNVVGYFRSEVGTGEAARQLITALDAHGVPLLPVHGQTVPVSRQGHAYETAEPEDAPFPVNLICMNADMLPEFARQVGERFFAERYSIGLWFWEVSRFPERWRDSFSLLEEVWAPTAHVAAALEQAATIPVHTVRIPVQPAPFARRSRAELGLPQDSFLFLFSFDYLSVFERKNPLAVIDAFVRAFAPGDGAGLVLKCINRERDPGSHARLLAAAAGRDDIVVIDRYLTPSDNLALTDACDCYVSLHRAEGLGLVMAEAMWLGKPVIATGYSGNLDFMTADNSLLVDHALVPIGPGVDPYPADGEWAQPDVEHAARLMRGLFDDRESAAALGARAAADIRRTHSPRAAGEIIGRRLESIRATGRARRVQDPVAGRPRAAAALTASIRRGPLASARGRARSGRRLVRRAMLRIMRPFTAYQQAVNLEVVAALDELRAGLAEQRRAAARDRARLLAELRRLQGAAGAGLDPLAGQRTISIQSSDRPHSDRA